MDLQHSQKTAKSAHSNESVIYCIENMNNLVLNHCVITSFWLVCESNTALLVLLLTCSLILSRLAFIANYVIRLI